MISLLAEVSGLDFVAGGLATAAATAPTRARAAETKVGAAVKETAVETVAVDEGELRDSIEQEGGEVRATARHAPFVEFGTYKDAPQPFMGPALDEHEDEFVDEVGDIGVPW